MRIAQNNKNKIIMKPRRIVGNCIKLLKYFYYRSMYNRILKDKKRKEKLKVVFFVMFVDMWKSDELFTLLLNDSRFDPYIIPQLLQKNSLIQNIQNQLSQMMNTLNSTLPLILIQLPSISMPQPDLRMVASLGWAVRLAFQPANSMPEAQWA